MRAIDRRTFVSVGAAACCATPQVCADESRRASDIPPKPGAMGLSPNIKPPAHETHPGIYASRASETTYVIRCGERSVLVDAGFFRNAEAHLVNFEASGIDLASIAAVLVTHFHVDHAAGLAHVRERLGCPIIAHKNAAPAIQTGDPVVTAAQIPYLGWDFPFPPCPVDEIVEDGDTVTVGDTTFDVIHIPGHTPGCAGYLWDSNLITGDVLFPDGRLGWADVHWGSNLLDTLETMDRIDALAPSVLLPTHGLPFAFDTSISDKGRARAKHLLEDDRGGILRHTKRTERRSTQAKPRALKF